MDTPTAKRDAFGEKRARPPRLSTEERERRRGGLRPWILGQLPRPARPQYMRVLMDDVEGGTAEATVNGGRAAGDCLRACVASLLDLDADDVPHFVQYINHPEGTDSHLWYWALIGFCDAYGWRVGYSPDQPEGWALADGKSPRGHQHVVVVYDGELVHDPHPKGEGLVETSGWFTFERKHDSDGKGGA